MTYKHVRTSRHGNKTSIALAAALVLGVGCSLPLSASSASSATAKAKPSENAVKTATPIQHVVVIFQENVSFDHYFGTYPIATNPPGEPAFKAATGTPTANNLST